MSINSLGQFGGKYPTRAQQYQTAYSANWSTRNPAKMPYKPTTKTPTGSPYGKQWGQLTRQNKPGRDIWGGREIPGLKYSGGPAQRRDYWHQMAEQPRKISAPKIRQPLGGQIGGAFTAIGNAVPGSAGGATGNKMR